MLAFLLLRQLFFLGIEEDTAWTNVEWAEKIDEDFDADRVALTLSLVASANSEIKFGSSNDVIRVDATVEVPGLGVVFNILVVILLI